METWIAGLLGLTTLLGALNLGWNIFGPKVTAVAKTEAKVGIDLLFGKIEAVPFVATHAALLTLLQKADVLTDDLVTNEIAAASAVVSKDGFTKQALADLSAAALATLKSTWSADEAALISGSPGAMAQIMTKVNASVATAVASMKTYKLASGVLVKLPAGAPLPEAGATLVATA